MNSIEKAKQYKQDKALEKQKAKDLLKREKARIASSRKVSNLTKKVSQGKSIKTRKKINQTTLKKKKRKELLLRAKKVVYVRDKDICQHCDKKCVGSDRHASHVIPVSATGRLALYPINMKVLCYHCHLNRRHKNPIEAGRWFASKFPERLQELERIESEIGMGSITLDELEQIERIIEKDEKKYYI